MLVSPDPVYMLLGAGLLCLEDITQVIISSKEGIDGHS
jgi:hypothetical protein